MADVMIICLLMKTIKSINMVLYCTISINLLAFDISTVAIEA